MKTKFSIATFRVSGCHACGQDLPAIAIQYGRRPGVKGGKHLALCADCEQELLRVLLHRALNDGRI